MPYEYKKLKVAQETHYVSEREMNELGADGWIFVAYNDVEEVYIFMREKENE